MKIRRAKLSDTKEINNLIKKTLKKVNIKDYSKKQIEVLIEKNTLQDTSNRIKEGKVFCAVENTKIIGIAGVYGNRLGGFYVSPNKINKGIGKQLLEVAENYMVKNKRRKAKLSSTITALEFYKKHGYKVIKREKWEPEKGIVFPVVEMEKKLK